MSPSSPRRALWTALFYASVAIAGVNASDESVCTLPASSLYFYRNANANTTGGANTTSSANVPRTRCWSDSVGVTVNAECVMACSCRLLETETSASSGVESYGVCLNNSMNYKCAIESGLADCSAYTLNADGSSTLKNSGVSERTQAIANTPTVGTITKGDDEKSGMKAWVWAIIVASIVLFVGLIAFTVSWFKNRPKYAKGSSSMLERTIGVDGWKYGEALEGEPRPTAARPTQARDANPSLVSGIAGVSYHTYRLDAGHAYRVEDSAVYAAPHTPISSISDNGLSSIELQSPVHYQYAQRQSSFTGRVSERLTGDSRLSYASASSYGSEMDLFSSQVTFEDSEPHGTALAVEDQAQSPPRQQHTYDDSTCPRKQSTEF